MNGNLSNDEFPLLFLYLPSGFTHFLFLPPFIFPLRLCVAATAKQGKGERFVPLLPPWGKAVKGVPQVRKTNIIRESNIMNIFDTHKKVADELLRINRIY